MTKTTAMNSNESTTPRRESSEKGASLVEYALLCCLVSIAAIAAIRLLGTNVSTQFSDVATQVGYVELASVERSA